MSHTPPEFLSWYAAYDLPLQGNPGEPTFWCVRRVVLGGDTEVVAMMPDAPLGNCDTAYRDGEQVARLMAAAPEMYEALSNVRDSGAFECCCGETPCCGTCISALVEKALKKVEEICSTSTQQP